MARRPLKPINRNLRLNLTAVTAKTRPSMSVREIMEATDSSPTVGLNSPMTRLAMNMRELSTERVTPKRRLSLSSVDTPPSGDSTAFIERSFSCASSVESGVFVDSPTLLDSPTIESYAQRYKPDIPIEAFTKKKTIAFRRINSLPPPALRLDCDSPVEMLDSMESDEQCHSAPVPSTSTDTSCSTSSTVTKLNFFAEEASSQDSGIGLDKDPSFKIPAPVVLRRKSRLNDISEEANSPHKYSPIKSPQKRSLSFALGTFPTANTDGDSPVRLKRSSFTCSTGSDDDDDGFLDLADSEVSEINNQGLQGISSLMNDPVIDEPATSSEEINTTPVTRRILPVKRFLQRSQSVDVQSIQFKRSKPSESQASHSKRWKSEKSHDDSCLSAGERPPTQRLHRCYSETADMIMSAVHRMSEQPDLIADSSKPYLLPLVKGKHQDLKSITPETLSLLITGEYADEVEDFHIIDCRYPYEFEGGHIQNALNIYTREKLLENYLRNPRKTQDPNKRFLVIFHCEFSSERGPSLHRFLRSQDRECNKECYPQLYYPEMYLLEGGYKAFFEHYKFLCEPQRYKQMLDKEHSEDLRKFRAKSKSWAGEKREGRPGLRNLKF